MVDSSIIVYGLGRKITNNEYLAIIEAKKKLKRNIDIKECGEIVYWLI